MNAHDLLEAFQAVDAQFLEETAVREQRVSQKTLRQNAAVMWEKKEANMRHNKLWQGLMGAAAVIAVFSIAAAGVAAIRPNSDMVADQPEETDTTGLTDTTASDETETTTETTDLQLPSEEFVEVTAAPTVEEPENTEEEQSYMEIYYSSSSTKLSISGAGTLPWETVELGEAGEKMQFEFVLKKLLYSGDDFEQVNTRVVVVQDGALIPFAFSEDGEPALWQDVGVSASYFVENKVDIWLTPNHQNEYSLLSVVAIMDPDPEWLGTGQFIGKENVYVADTVLHTDTPTADSAETPYALASAEDYIDFPEALRGNRVSSSITGFDGISVGRRMDYQANWENRYAIRSNWHNQAAALGRDEVYLKLHLHADALADHSLPAGDGTEYQPVLEGIYILVLCDGKPMQAFDGKSVLYIDTPDDTNTLNYQLPIDETITDGDHYFTAVAIGKWQNPLERSDHVYYLNFAESIPIIIE